MSSPFESVTPFDLHIYHMLHAFTRNLLERYEGFLAPFISPLKQSNFEIYVMRF